MAKVIITGGGTGGHIYPGIAVASALMAQGVEVRWLGAARGLEKDLVPKANIPLTLLPLKPFRQGGIFSKFKSLLSFMLAVRKAIQFYRKEKPALIVSMGGYASGAGGLAAYLCRIPIVLHEQNTRAGWTNRMVSHFARTIFLGFPGAFTGDKVIDVGNPVREVFKTIPPPGERYGVHTGPIKLMILGGSQGARIFHETLPAVFSKLSQIIAIDILHIAGQKNLEAAQKAYDELGLKAKVIPYHDHIEEAFKETDLVVSRAGAMAVTEIMHAGVASVLVPLPSAVDDHQTKNAEFLSASGASVLLPQSEMTPEKTLNVLKKLCASRETLHKMAALAYGQRYQHTEEKMIQIIQEFL